MIDDYPEASADEFPAPPHTITDGEGRTVEIRTAAGDDDVEGLVEMYLDFEPSDRAQGIPPVRESQIRTWLDTLFGPDALNVLACHDGTPAGHATLVPDENGETYELAIFVLHGYQGAGIGTHLLERLLGYAQEEGLEKVWLSVERWNDAAIALYQRVGFEMQNTESFELVMSIRL
jgi:ribosomal protein S18 acetylase RimI-like enzyme